MNVSNNIEVYERNDVIAKKIHESNSRLAIAIFVFSLLISLATLVLSAVYKTYTTLFLLPFTFGVCSVVFMDVYRYVPKNLGVSLLLVLFFARDVISPLALCVGNFSITVTLNVDSNTTFATLLIVYETIAVFAAMKYALNRGYKKKPVEHNYKKPLIKKSYIFLFFVLLALLAVCYITVPSLLSSYRTIFNIRDEFFVNFEDAQVVDKYGTTFITKLALVTGQYLVRILTILIPSVLIVFLARKKTLIRKILALLCCLFPLLFIGGAIARSLIYVVILFFLFNYMFFKGEMGKKTILLLVGAGLLVVVYWIFISSKGTVDFEILSRKFSAYFSGVNVVSGVFNLPTEFEYRLRYFVYDFTSTFPYGNTIFNIQHETVQPFFNLYNQSAGQIPPTIAMSYYYFGPLLAPLYSVIFTYIAVRAAKKLGVNKYGNPFRITRLLLVIFGFAMGVVMYNIEITMTNFFTLYFPLYIMEKLCYRGE